MKQDGFAYEKAATTNTPRNMVKYRVYHESFGSARVYAYRWRHESGWTAEATSDDGRACLVVRLGVTRLDAARRVRTYLEMAAEAPSA